MELVLTNFFESNFSLFIFTSKNTSTKFQKREISKSQKSFNSLGSKIVLFGGVTNRSDAPERVFKPDYLNDIYFLDLKSGSGVQNWLKPECTGQEKVLTIFVRKFL